MKRLLTVLAATALATACSDDASDVPAVPFEPELAVFDASTESELQDALTTAQSNGQADVIHIRGNIALSQPLTYTSDEDLTLQGHGARITGPQTPIAPPPNSSSRVGEPTVGDALQVIGVNGAPDLTIDNVWFEQSTGHGIYFEVSENATGTVDLRLSNVHLKFNGLSGLWFEDQASTAQGDIDSDASVSLHLLDVQVLNNGFATDEDGGCPGASEDDGCEWSDFDGIRINEGGDGDIHFDLENVRILLNAADGLELDEKGDGDVEGSVVNGNFDLNGPQPQLTADLEDGFDIDEAGDGTVAVHFERVSVDGNLDEGIDLDEEGDGNIEAWFSHVSASRNQDDNIKFSEDADLEEEGVDTDHGSILIDFAYLTVTRSPDGDGIKLEEFAGGVISGDIANSTVILNDSDGLDLDAQDAGDGTVTLTHVNASMNGDDDIDASSHVNVVVN